MADAARASREVATLTDRIDVLLNNAGGIGSERVLTGEGNEAILAGNHLGPFLPTRELLPLLRNAAARSGAGQSMSRRRRRIPHRGSTPELPPPSGSYFFRRELVEMNARALDDVVSERLWATSEALIAVAYGFRQWPDSFGKPTSGPAKEQPMTRPSLDQHNMGGLWLHRRAAAPI